MNKNIILLTFITISIYNNNINSKCCENNCKCGSGKNNINNLDKEIKKEESKKQDDKPKTDPPKEDEHKEDHLKNKKSILKNKLTEVIQNNEKLDEKDKLQINIKEKDIDDCKDDKSLDKISEELSDLNNKIIAKISEKDKNLAKQMLLDKRNKIINIFDEVDELINKIREIININYISYKKDQIQKEENIKNLNKIESDLLKNKLELTEFYKKITTDTPICKDKNDFIIKFNERKKELISKNYFKNNDLNNKLKADLEEAKSDEYFIMYQEMTKDVFSHEISLDLQIYRYILKLEGIIKALDNIFKQKVQYDFYTEYSDDKAGYNAEIFNKDDNYYLDYYSDIDTKKYKWFKNIYSGIFYIKNEPLKYVRCEKDKCNYDEREKYCISCKLRNLLEKENIGDLYKEIYFKYGDSSNAGGTVRKFIYNHINSKYKKKQYFHETFEFIDYENDKEEYKKTKKVLMLEWSLTIEFMKRFIQGFTCKKEFFLYRTMGFDDSHPYKPANELLSQAVDSTSLFGPCYFQMSKKTIMCLHKIKAKLYCCFFNHIINPFSEEKIYKSGVKDETGKNPKKFLNCKLKADYECEIGYIPVNQKYTEEVKYTSGSEEDLKKLQNYIYKRSVENFKQNMLNNDATKTAKLHVFKDDKIINL